LLSKVQSPRPVTPSSVYSLRKTQQATPASTMNVSIRVIRIAPLPLPILVARVDRRTRAGVSASRRLRDDGNSVSVTRASGQETPEIPGVAGDAGGR
jgi:hypothetical protein